MDPMTVALVHNFYRQPGGEDAVFSAEGELLERHHHEVVRFTMDNATIAETSPAALARATVWNRAAHAGLRRALAGRAVRVVHFHNTFPLVSPAAYYAARSEGAAVVQTLHNYRLLCPSANLFRRGQVCEACAGRALPWPGVVHGCYRGSRTATAVSAAMLATHRALGTWSRAVHLYVALSEFSRQKFVEYGLPADRIRVKPNFLATDPGAGPHDGGFALYVGRLAEEKGVRSLLHEWADLGSRYPLQVVGDGPLAGLVSRAGGGVRWLGQLPKADVFALMQRAAVLVFPSEWMEPFGLTLVEAMATGLPVIASAQGAATEIVEDGETGWLVPCAGRDALAAAVAAAFSRRDELARMGRRARALYEERYGAARAYDSLITLYRAAESRAAAESS